MTPDPGDGMERRYSDAEVRILLERAAHLQGANLPARHRGFTLAQIEEIAQEAQIDVDRLRQAARDLDRGAIRPAGPMERLAGAPFRLRVERSLPFEMDASEFGNLVSSIAMYMDDAGTANLVGRTFTWSSKATSGRNTELRVTAQKGRTHVWVGERYTEVAAGVFGGILGGAGVGGGAGIAAALGTPALAFVAPFAVVGGVYAACRIGYTAYVRSRARSIEDLCDRIARDLTAMHEASD